MAPCAPIQVFFILSDVILQCFWLKSECRQSWSLAFSSLPELEFGEYIEEGARFFFWPSVLLSRLHFCDDQFPQRGQCLSFISLEMSNIVCRLMTCTTGPLDRSCFELLANRDSPSRPDWGLGPKSSSSRKEQRTRKLKRPVDGRDFTGIR